MSRRSKQSGSTAPAPAVIRYFRRKLPVVVRSRIRLATFSAATAKSSILVQSFEGEEDRQTEKSEAMYRRASVLRHYGTLMTFVDAMNIGSGTRREDTHLFMGREGASQW